MLKEYSEEALVIKNYSATSPCPICGRYKSAYQNKCHGFIGERFIYCSRIGLREGQAPDSFTPWGKPLYKYPLKPSIAIATKEHKTYPPLQRVRVADASAKTKKKKPEIKTPKKLTYNESNWKLHPGPDKDTLAKLDETIKEYHAKGIWPYT